MSTPTTNPFLRLLAPATLGLWLGAGVPACGGDGESEASGSSGPLECEHGMAYDCACPDGSMGTKTCAHDSSGFEACMCGGDDGTAGPGGSDGSSGGNGSGSDGPGSSGSEPGSTGLDGSTGTATTAASEETSTNGSAPVVQITHPGNGDQRPAGVIIPLIGEASDPEDGVLSGASLVWTDSIEGELGQGESVDTMLFTLGEHTITLTAADADGNVVEDQISLVIFEQ